MTRSCSTAGELDLRQRIVYRARLREAARRTPSSRRHALRNFAGEERARGLRRPPFAPDGTYLTVFSDATARLREGVCAPSKYPRAGDARRRRPEPHRRGDRAHRRAGGSARCWGRWCCWATTGTMRPRRGPSMPRAYSDALLGVEIGPDRGLVRHVDVHRPAGGRARHRDRPAMGRFPRSREHGCACWSEPIRLAGGEVVGSFAMYYCEPRSPSEVGDGGHHRLGAWSASPSSAIAPNARSNARPGSSPPARSCSCMQQGRRAGLADRRGVEERRPARVRPRLASLRAHELARPDPPGRSRPHPPGDRRVPAGTTGPHSPRVTGCGRRRRTATSSTSRSCGDEQRGDPLGGGLPARRHRARADAAYQSGSRSGTGTCTRRRRDAPVDRADRRLLSVSNHWLRDDGLPAKVIGRPVTDFISAEVGRASERDLQVLPHRLRPRPALPDGPQGRLDHRVLLSSAAERDEQGTSSARAR